MYKAELKNEGKHFDKTEFTVQMNEWITNTKTHK